MELLAPELQSSTELELAPVDSDVLDSGDMMKAFLDRSALRLGRLGAACFAIKVLDATNFCITAPSLLAFCNELLRIRY
jgi:hypothetical protein